MKVREDINLLVVVFDVIIFFFKTDCNYYIDCLSTFRTNPHAR